MVAAINGHCLAGGTEQGWPVTSGFRRRLPRSGWRKAARASSLEPEERSGCRARSPRKWAETIGEKGPLAVRAAKETILRGLSMPLPDGLRLETFLSGTLRGTEDAVEAPKAFAEKRKPNFQAR